jgi:hypothetical protein
VLEEDPRTLTQTETWFTCPLRHRLVFCISRAYQWAAPENNGRVSLRTRTPPLKSITVVRVQWQQGPHRTPCGMRGQESGCPDAWEHGPSCLSTLGQVQTRASGEGLTLRVQTCGKAGPRKQAGRNAGRLDWLDWPPETFLSRQSSQCRGSGTYRLGLDGLPIRCPLCPHS